MVFEELVNRVTPKLKGIIYKLNYSSSLFNKEDLFQEALMHLWRQLREGHLNDKTDSYILQGCYFHLKNYLRTARVKNKEMSLEGICQSKDVDKEEVLAISDETTQNFLGELNCRMFAEAVRNNGLTKREKGIIFLHAEGFTTREIGLRVNLSHVRVAKLLGEIKEKCKKYLDGV